MALNNMLTGGTTLSKRSSDKINKWDCAYVYITVIIFLHSVLLNRSVFHYIIEGSWLTWSQYEILVMTAISYMFL
jgi:hypothetical protein